MPPIRPDLERDDVRIVRFESDLLVVDVAPAVGGRIVSFIHKPTGHEFLWRNPELRLSRLSAGSPYDPNFYGGIDELLPNDIPESLHGIDCPDHGDLWTTVLDGQVLDDRLRLQADLPRFGLRYEREMRLDPERPILQLTYRISNQSAEPRHFLWKLHAALAIQAGDVIDCPARHARVVDRAWSRFESLVPFDWPKIQGTPAHIIPPQGSGVDFFYLYDLAAGTMSWRRPAQDLSFCYRFDRKVFPYAWLFASYGGFDGHYTAILEPCTAMPISVPEAAAQNQCSHLEPGGVLETQVQVWAGSTKECDFGADIHPTP